MRGWRRVGPRFPPPTISIRGSSYIVFGVGSPGVFDGEGASPLGKEANAQGCPGLTLPAYALWRQ